MTIIVPTDSDKTIYDASGVLVDPQTSASITVSLPDVEPPTPDYVIITSHTTSAEHAVIIQGQPGTTIRGASSVTSTTPGQRFVFRLAEEGTWSY